MSFRKIEAECDAAELISTWIQPRTFVMVKKNLEHLWCVQKDKRCTVSKSCLLHKIKENNALKKNNI